jgi:glutamate synthase domain-containing protein 3
VQKNVGDNSIVRMRRGNIIIGGNIGSGSCLELISGSVVVLGKIGNNFCYNARRGTIFTRDKSICREYIRANQTDLTFFNFYKIKINKILNKSIINSSKPVRYFGTKSGKELIELFVI